jgi:hypothetical protein
MEMEFTEDIHALKVFLETFDAKSMETKIDRPEDVQGGLKLSLMQDWTEEAVKRVVLICDAPGHGYYKSEYDTDNYPRGTPDMPSLKTLMKEFAKKNIAF